MMKMHRNPRRTPQRAFRPLSSSSSFNKFLLILILTIFLMMLMFSSTSDAARKMGGRRRGKQKKQSSPRLIALSPKLKAYYENENGAEIVKSSHFDYEFDLGHKIVFICVAKGDPPPRITWFKDGIEIYAHPYLQISEWRLKHQRVKSKLEIDPARQMDSGNYECQANNMYSVDRRNFKADF